MEKSFRLPTAEEWRELLENCTWQWETIDDVNGYKVTATNGNFIFLPAAGYIIDNINYGDNCCGYYWSESLYSDDNSLAWSCNFYSKDQKMSCFGFDFRHTVRLVSEEKSIGIDMGLSVNWCEHNWRNSAETDINQGDHYTFDEAIKLFKQDNTMSEKSCNTCANQDGQYGCKHLQQYIDDCKRHDFENYEPKLGMVQNQEVAESWNGALKDCKMCKYQKDKTKSFCNLCNNYSHFDYDINDVSIPCETCVKYDKTWMCELSETQRSFCIENEFPYWSYFESCSNENDFKNKDNIMPIDPFSFAPCKPFNPKPAKPNRIRPDYYVINGVECKDVIGEFSYNIGAAMKYLWRHGRKTEEGMSEKDKAVEDLKKAIEHIKFEIEKLSK